MSNGRKAPAPCGHPGEVVVGGYVQCDLGCDSSDGVPVDIRDIKTAPLCKHCGSGNVEAWDNDFSLNGRTMWQCHGHNCGKSFYA